MKSCILDIETESLDPKEGRVVCIGTLDTSNGKTVVFHDEDEKKMLIDFLDYFHNENFREIVGYNILFDLRFLFARLLKYSLYSNGFFKARYEDLMAIMKSVGYRYSYNKPGTLDEWATFLFGSGKIQLPSNVGDLYHEGKISQIIQYNRQDLEITFKLWERVQMVLNNSQIKTVIACKR